MARISGIELSDNWKLDYALTKIKGIGWSRSSEIVEKLGYKPKQTVSTLTADDVAKITAALDDYMTEGDLLRRVREDVQRLREIGTYRGIRHARGLPVRGQRTKSNARTRRGKRKTVGSFRKDVLTKMQQS